MSRAMQRARPSPRAQLAARPTTPVPPTAGVWAAADFPTAAAARMRIGRRPPARRITATARHSKVRDFFFYHIL